jgi:hypothetical protein
MKSGGVSVLPLAVGCAIAAAVFGFGVTMLGFQSVYAGQEGRLVLMQIARLAVFVGLGVLLALVGGWRGVMLAIGMAILATFVVWLLLPFALVFASVNDPASYAERFAGFRRPPYADYATFDVIGVAISAALAQGLKMMAHVDPGSTPRDE